MMKTSANVSKIRTAGKLGTNRVFHNEKGQYLAVAAFFASDVENLLWENAKKKKPRGCRGHLQVMRLSLRG
jgi:hypothetical protein